MDSVAISRVLEKHLSNIAFTVCARDVFLYMFKKSRYKRVVFIVNLDNSSQPGSHWIAVYLNSYNRIYYFDSFGNPPIHIDILSAFASSKAWRYSNIQLQNIDTYVCGQYAILFSLFIDRCDRPSMFAKRFLSIHSSRYIRDKFVFNYCMQRFTVKAPFRS